MPGGQFSSVTRELAYKQSLQRRKQSQNRDFFFLTLEALDPSVSENLS